MELKRGEWVIFQRSRQSLNRTFMELKHDKALADAKAAKS